MSRTRRPLTLLLLAALASAAVAGPFKAKKVDPARVRPLLEALKSDPDERKRKAAADELGGADAREFPEVATALSNALQKDTSAGVRAEAAQSLGRLDQVFPLAGVALEAAASGDSSPLVRLAAKQTLWEYHLNGYRSPKATDGALAQTVEPPIAAPSGARPVVALIPAPPPPSVSLFTPPSLPTAAPAPAAPLLPAVGPLFGPRASRPSFLSELVSGVRSAMPAKPAILKGPPPIPNVTSEPPVAKRPPLPMLVPPPSIPSVMLPPSVAVPPPTPAAVPMPVPLPPAPRTLDYIPTLPPFMPDLPSVVLPPDATPLRPAPMPKIPATLPAPK